MASTGREPPSTRAQPSCTPPSSPQRPRLSRRPLLAALGLASLTALSGCAKALDAMFLLLVLYSYAWGGCFVSLIGILVAVLQMRERRRGIVNVVIAIPFAVVAVCLHAWATHGFTYFGDAAFEDATGWLPGSTTRSSSHLTLRALLAFVGSPLLWLGTAIVTAAVAPRQRAGEAQGPVPPLTGEKVMTAAAPVALVLALYASLLLIPHGSVAPPPVAERPARTASPVTSAAAEAEQDAREMAERAEADAEQAAREAAERAARRMPRMRSPFFPESSAGNPFELLWKASLGEWNHHISFTPTGEVLAMGTSRLLMLDAATGPTLKQGTSCDTPHSGGFGWLDDHHAALVCRDAIRGYELPGLRSSTLVHRQTFDAAGGAVHPKLIIASDADEILAKKARVRLFDPHTHAKLAELAIPADEVGSVDIAPDGTLFALGFDGKIEIREAPSGRVVGEMETSSRPSGLAFSPDGKLLVADAESFKATVFEVPSMRPLRSYSIGSWLSQSRWLPDGTIVATGSDGILAFFPDGTQASGGIRLGGQGLAVSADGTRVCAGDRDGTLWMYRFARKGSDAR